MTNWSPLEIIAAQQAEKAAVTARLAQLGYGRPQATARPRAQVTRSTYVGQDITGLAVYRVPADAIGH